MPPATCEGCMTLSLRSPFSPSQPWARQDAPFSLVAMARRTVRRSVRTKSKTDQVCGAKPATGDAVSPSLEQERSSAFHVPVWCARSASTGRLPRRPILLFSFSLKVFDGWRGAGAQARAAGDPTPGGGASTLGLLGDRTRRVGQRRFGREPERGAALATPNLTPATSLRSRPFPRTSTHSES